MVLALFQISGDPLLSDLFASQKELRSVRVEVFLAKGQKKEAEAIRKGFEKVSVDNVHFQFFRAGRPPGNVAIGRAIEASIARLAIELALEHTRGIQLLVPEALLPAGWIGIGTSAFDEQNQIPITAEDVDKLRDPFLTTEQFHKLYRELSKGGKVY